MPTKTNQRLPNMEIDLSLKNIYKTFGDFTAVDDVSIDIPKGQFFSILGPSGCGKTTLLRMIAGFANPTSGQILIGGQPMNGLAPNRRPVSLVFQHLALFPMMSVAKNIAFGLERRRMSKSEIGPKVEKILETVGLPGYGDKQISQLSGGQKQRVAIARCLILEPTVLLLDEPLGALDLKLREQMKIELKKLQAEVGTTFLYITHDQSEALVMSDKIAIMNQGRVEQLDSPLNCYHKPASSFVASFVGESNHWQGRVEKSTAKSLLVKTDEGHDLKCSPNPKLQPGEAVDVFVRTEAIHPISHTKLPNKIQVKVTNVIFDGNTVRLLAKPSEQGEEITIAIQQTSAEQQFSIGDSLRIGWEAEAGLCFPRKGQA